MNIYEKLAAITAELNAVAKNLKVGEGRSSYKAVGEADVLAAVKPLEAKYKVYSYPCARHIVDSDVITTKKSYNGQESESSKFFMRVETTYRFVNTEEPKDYCEITTYGDGVDSGDKAPGKAMTYGDKYALLKAYKIITGDDPDQTASEDGGFHRSYQLPGPKCSRCGNEIMPYNDGKKAYTAQEMAQKSTQMFGEALCSRCSKAAAKDREFSATAQALRHEDAGDRV